MPEARRLRIKDLEASDGPLGRMKDDNSVFPGEELFLRFTVDGAKVNDDSYVNVDLEILLRDATGTELLCVTSNLSERVALGRNTFPAQARVQLPPSCVYGDYVLTLKVLDHQSDQSDAAVYPFILQPVTELSIVNPRFFYDINATVPAPPGGMVGQTLYYNLSIVGITVGSSGIRGLVSAQVFEHNTGEPMMKQPVEAMIVEDNEQYLKTLQVPVVDFMGQLVLTRAGEFVLQVEVKDLGPAPAAAPEDGDGSAARATMATPSVAQTLYVTDLLVQAG